MATVVQVPRDTRFESAGQGIGALIGLIIAKRFADDRKAEEEQERRQAFRITGNLLAQALGVEKPAGTRTTGGGAPVPQQPSRGAAVTEALAGSVGNESITANQGINIVIAALQAQQKAQTKKAEAAATKSALSNLDIEGAEDIAALPSNLQSTILNIKNREEKTINQKVTLPNGREVNVAVPKGMTLAEQQKFIGQQVPGARLGKAPPAGPAPAKPTQKERDVQSFLRISRLADTQENRDLATLWFRDREPLFRAMQQQALAEAEEDPSNRFEPADARFNRILQIAKGQASNIYFRRKGLGGLPEVQKQAMDAAKQAVPEFSDESFADISQARSKADAIRIIARTLPNLPAIEIVDYAKTIGFSAVKVSEILEALKANGEYNG